MNRSFFKLVFVLLIVGLIPFVSSLFIVNDLISGSVAVGLNPEVRERVSRSADTSREFFRAERLSNELAADLIVSDPRWQACPLIPDDIAPTEHFEAFIGSFSQLHPRLTHARVTDADGTQLFAVEWSELREDHMSTEERRPVPTCTGQLEITLTFQLPRRFEEEHIALGETLMAFRALDSNRVELGKGMRRTYFYFGGAIAMLALLIGALFARRTTRRIARISDAAGRVAAGDLSIHVDDRSGDEIGALARKFNSMVDDLKLSQDRVSYLQRVTAWQDIARRLAHEIKNPLTPILLSMQQLDHKYDQLGNDRAAFRPLLNDALEIVVEEVETLRALVKEFSDFARLPEVNVAETSVSHYLEDFVRTNPQLAQRATIELEFGADVENVKAAIDPVLMRRVLVNVLENAIQAGDDDKQEVPKLEIRLLKKGEDLQIRILDEGTGVSDENLDHLFDPYFTTKTEGTGLGLAIVKKIVLEHQGKVNLSNRSDEQGCELTITLPLVE